MYIKIDLTSSNTNFTSSTKIISMLQELSFIIDHY